MGEILRYKCVACGFETEASVGHSGIGTQYMLPYICDRTKELVFVCGNSAFPAAAFMRKDSQTVVEEAYPEHPSCPECKDHVLDEEWDQSTCPRCKKRNVAIEIGCWD
jgi:hypothetical protein